jgi:hypothetical protein
VTGDRQGLEALGRGRAIRADRQVVAKDGIGDLGRNGADRDQSRNWYAIRDVVPYLVGVHPAAATVPRR